VRRLAALVLCTLVFGVACSRTTSAPAATVNGTPIPTKDLVEELNAIQANPDFINSLQSGAPAGGLTVVGSTAGSFDAAFVAQVLLRELDYSMIHAEITKRHVVIDDACRNEARNDAILNLGNKDATTGEQLFNKFPKRYQDTLVQRNADVIALEAALSGQQCGKSPDGAGYYNTHPEEFTKVCVSFIAVADQAIADAVTAQARGGADFAVLAQQVSIDPTSKANGGSIGCALPSAFTPPVAALLTAAKSGEVLDPIPGSSGFSIVKVTDRQLASLDEGCAPGDTSGNPCVRTQAEELATSNAGKSFGTWLRQARADAKVTVDPRYGTFDSAAFQINPPTLDLNPSSSPPSPSSSSDTP
jgi:parvulin-like peptidyl-prolyl cis-trans isomerase-like protein